MFVTVNPPATDGRIFTTLRNERRKRDMQIITLVVSFALFAFCAPGP